MRTALVFYNN